eukprot:scaffold3167_cov105-Isochrysis_galbana.AAC.5
MYSISDGWTGRDVKTTVAICAVQLWGRLSGGRSSSIQSEPPPNAIGMYGISENVEVVFCGAITRVLRSPRRRPSPPRQSDNGAQILGGEGEGSNISFAVYPVDARVRLQHTSPPLRRCPGITHCADPSAANVGVMCPPAASVLHNALKAHRGSATVNPLLIKQNDRSLHPVQPEGPGCVPALARLHAVQVFLQRVQQVAEHHTGEATTALAPHLSAKAVSRPIFKLIAVFRRGFIDLFNQSAGAYQRRRGGRQQLWKRQGGRQRLWKRQGKGVIVRIIWRRRRAGRGGRRAGRGGRRAGRGGRRAGRGGRRVGQIEEAGRGGRRAGQIEEAGRGGRRAGRGGPGGRRAGQKAGRGGFRKLHIVGVAEVPNFVKSGQSLR